MPLTIEPEGPPEEGEQKQPLQKRLFWFVAIWLMSAGAVAAVAYALRALILPRH